MNGYAACRDGMAATVFTRFEFSYTDFIEDTPRRSHTDGTIRSTGPRWPRSAASHGGCAG